MALGSRSTSSVVKTEQLVSEMGAPSRVAAGPDDRPPPPTIPRSAGEAQAFGRLDGLVGERGTWARLAAIGRRGTPGSTSRGRERGGAMTTRDPDEADEEEPRGRLVHNAVLAEAVTSRRERRRLELPLSEDEPFWMIFELNLRHA